MKKRLCILIALVLALTACAQAPTLPQTGTPETTTPPTSVPETTVPETTVPPEATVPPTTAPLHSELYLEDCSLEQLLEYWDEVVLDVEYTEGDGDFTLVQKWLAPISCRILGAPTDEDLQVLETFFAQLNGIPGFPGIRMAEEYEFTNLSLSFLGPEDFRNGFSDVVHGEDAWGAVQFWYWTDTNEIYDARIGYRTDIPQTERNSILLEEIVNGLGLNDSLLREDSIVYQHSNDNLELSDVDLLILKLLFNPAIRPGMNADECHEVLAELYY